MSVVEGTVARAHPSVEAPVFLVDHLPHGEIGNREEVKSHLAVGETSCCVCMNAPARYVVGGKQGRDLIRPCWFCTNCDYKEWSARCIYLNRSGVRRVLCGQSRKVVGCVVANGAELKVNPGRRLTNSALRGQIDTVATAPENRRKVKSHGLFSEDI